MASEETKTDKILKFIFEFLEGKLHEKNLMTLRDRLQADFGVSHELLAPSAYWGRTDRPEGANDAALRSYRPGQNAVRDVAVYNQAIRECAPLVGNNFPIACDSAAAVYQETLRRMGVSTRATDLAGLRQLLDLARKAQHMPGEKRVTLAMDARTVRTITEQSPGLARFLPGAA